MRGRWAISLLLAAGVLAGCSGSSEPASTGDDPPSMSETAALRTLWADPIFDEGGLPVLGTARSDDPSDALSCSHLDGDEYEPVKVVYFERAGPPDAMDEVDLGAAATELGWTLVDRNETESGSLNYGLERTIGPYRARAVVRFEDPSANGRTVSVGASLVDVTFCD